MVELGPPLRLLPSRPSSIRVRNEKVLRRKWRKIASERPFEESQKGPASVERLTGPNCQQAVSQV